jgi:hypothetical protein
VSTSQVWNALGVVGWLPYAASGIAPANARYFKLRLIGCHTANTTAGTTYFDGVQLTKSTLSQEIELNYDAAFGNSTQYWTVPAGVGALLLDVIGGGGAGGGYAGPNIGGAGGGAGGYARSLLAVTPGSIYAFTVGAGGTGGAGAGGAGQSSTFTGITANGGAGGAQGAGAGGAGGTATGGNVFNDTGGSGNAGGTVNEGSLGGAVSRIGFLGIGHTTATTAVPPRIGGGGGGGANAGKPNGLSGGNGRITLRF